MWYNNVQHFGQRGQQEHISMTMDNFLYKTDETSGNKYIEFLEDPTKCRQSGLHHKPRVTNPKMFPTGGMRCPVLLFDLYVSRRPLHLRNSGRFYLTPKRNFEHDNIWYTCNPIGKNKIGSFMKDFIANTDVENSGKRLTNHSGRKTLVKKLKKADVPECSIIKVTGHKSTEGLKNYDPADQAEFKKMSNAISNEVSFNLQSNSCSSNRKSTTESSNSFVFENCNVTINNNQVVYNQEKKRNYVIYSDSSQSQ